LVDQADGSTNSKTTLVDQADGSTNSKTSLVDQADGSTISQSSRLPSPTKNRIPTLGIRSFDQVLVNHFFD
ncbi:hypothetical protein, partial [Falseniella ignava]